jgi:hypothetical protein
MVASSGLATFVEQLVLEGFSYSRVRELVVEHKRVDLGFASIGKHVRGDCRCRRKIV